MFATLTVLTALISLMFVASVISAISEARRENEKLREFAANRSAF